MSRGLFASGDFDISLPSRFWKGAFLLALGIHGLLLAYSTMRISLSATLADSMSVADLREALRLDRMNPEAHRRLGLVYPYSYSFDNLEAAERLFDSFAGRLSSGHGTPGIGRSSRPLVRTPVTAPAQIMPLNAP